MTDTMFEWSQNPHADFVIAAYGVALALLLGLGLASWRKARRAEQAWREREQRRRP